MDRKHRSGGPEEWGEFENPGDGGLADMFEDEYSTEEWEPELRLSGLRLRETGDADRFTRVRADHRRQKAMKRRRDARRVYRYT